MTIKNGSAGVGTILLGPYHHVPRLRPSRLNPFTTHTSCTFGEVNVVSELTGLSVAGEVELWDDHFPIVEGGKLKRRRGRVLGDPRL